MPHISLLPVTLSALGSSPAAGLCPAPALLGPGSCCTPTREGSCPLMSPRSCCGVGCAPRWGRTMQGVCGAHSGVLWHGGQLETHPRWEESVAGRKPGCPGASPVSEAQQPLPHRMTEPRSLGKTSQVTEPNLQLRDFPSSSCPARTRSAGSRDRDRDSSAAAGTAARPAGSPAPAPRDHSIIQTPPCSQTNGNPVQMPHFEMHEASEERQ